MALHARARRGRYNAPGVDAKIVVMGNTGVGKTSLLHRYTQDKFDPRSTTSTTGAFFVTKKIDVNGHKVRLQLWDTAGQERFRSMAPMYYRGAHAALLLYDITNSASFQAIHGWLEELKRNCDPDLLIYIVGAKADLVQQRQVQEDFVRHSLATWFPPAKPPAPPTPPTASTFGYIRPRFTSITSLASIRPSTSSEPSEPAFSPGSPPPVRARADSHVGLMRSNTTTATPTALRVRTTSITPLGRSHSIAAAAIMSPSRFGTNWAELTNEDPTPPSSDSTAAEADGYKWGLSTDMRLFEVSAKEGEGIPRLFDSLIEAIIARRDAIEAEQSLKRRDSVMLSSSTPAWAVQADQEAAAEKAARSGWSCCAT